MIVQKWVTNQNSCNFYCYDSKLQFVEVCSGFTMIMLSILFTSSASYSLHYQVGQDEINQLLFYRTEKVSCCSTNAVTMNIEKLPPTSMPIIDEVSNQVCLALANKFKTLHELERFDRNKLALACMSRTNLHSIHSSSQVGPQLYPLAHSAYTD